MFRENVIKKLLCKLGSVLPTPPSLQKKEQKIVHLTGYLSNDTIFFLNFHKQITYQKKSDIKLKKQFDRSLSALREISHKDDVQPLCRI